MAKKTAQTSVDAKTNAVLKKITVKHCFVLKQFDDTSLLLQNYVLLIIA
jgi:hypothetical protein